MFDDRSKLGPVRRQTLVEGKLAFDPIQGFFFSCWADTPADRASGALARAFQKE